MTEQPISAPNLDHVDPKTPAEGRASWRFGHSPVEGEPEPDAVPEAGAASRSQGAPGDTAAEGGPQRQRPGRTASRGKARTRDSKRRPAHSVRLNEREHAVIRAAAEHTGKSVAAFLAHAALAAARDQSRTAAAIADEREALAALFAVRRQLGWAGSNVNQIAKALNSGADTPHVTEALADLRGALRAVQQAANRLSGQAPRATIRSGTADSANEEAA